MRWDNLRLTEDTEGPELPLIQRTAVTRTIDTPEFRGITFYEIQAKSIINKVPSASHVPFGWTINPYRGCSHACSYCADGDTPILMADGRTRPLRDVRAGDRIFGTVHQGSGRRYAVTEVLDHLACSPPLPPVSRPAPTRPPARHRYQTNSRRQPGETPSELATQGAGRPWTTQPAAALA